MALEALKKIADELRTAREQKDISLQQIASKTKIDIKFLQAIENANFDILPDVYMKAFIKEYAQYIELDFQSILQKYENVRLGKPEQAVVPDITVEADRETAAVAVTEKKFDSTESVQLTNTKPDETSTKKQNVNYFYVGIIVVLLLILIYVLFVKGSSPDIVQESFSQQVSNQDKPRFEMTKGNNNQTQLSPNVADSLRLSVQTLSRVWVKVSSDGKIIAQQVYLPDSRLNFAARKNFSITVGNAGVVKLLLNNKPIQNIGKPGEIRNLFITPDTVRYYTIILPTKNEAEPAKKN